jgi:hypothetical protein
LGSSEVILRQEGGKPVHLVSMGHRKIPFHLYLGILEVAQSMVDYSGSERCSWNTADVDLLHLSIVPYGFVDEIHVSKVSLQ